jgi:uncharacterized protein
VKVIVAGGSGFLGGALCRALLAQGHQVVVLTRGPMRGGPSDPMRHVSWDPEAPVPGAGASATGWSAELDGADAVINLAGAGLADKRWTSARKDVLRRSRTTSTRRLVAAIRAAARRPAVFISGSAVGYYGTTDDDVLDESFPPGSDALASICVEWEAHAQAAVALGCRVVIVRGGIALSRDGGALKKLLPAFQWFAGGPIASGRQYMSWIHLDDWVGLVLWVLRTPAVSGVINGTAPSPVTNEAFSAALGRALHRPSWLRVPAFALHLLVGEVADVALINGQRVVPKRALELGFAFTYPNIDSALRAAVERRR